MLKAEEQTEYNEKDREDNSYESRTKMEEDGGKSQGTLIDLIARRDVPSGT